MSAEWYIEPGDREPRTPAERAARERLAQIDGDPTHPANASSHPDHEAALAAKLDLWRAVLGDRNRTVATYRHA